MNRPKELNDPEKFDNLMENTNMDIFMNQESNKINNYNFDRVGTFDTTESKKISIGIIICS